MMPVAATAIQNRSGGHRGGDDRREERQRGDGDADVLPVCLAKPTDERASDVADRLPGPGIGPARDSGVDPSCHIGPC